MSKCKSHSGAKKRFRVNCNNKVKHRSANRGHNLGKESNTTTKNRRRRSCFTNTAAQNKLLRILGLKG